MNMKQTIKNVTSGFFRGENRCLKLREDEELFTSGFQRKTNSYFENAVIAYDLIEGYLKGEITIPEFDELVMDAITPSFTETTTELMAEQLIQMVKRYCRCESRKALFPGRNHLHYGSYDISTGCHAMFDDGTNLELVIFRIGKPSITQSGKTKDKGVSTSIELALLSKMGERYVREGESRNIIASYYFLRKDSDRSTGIVDHDFFSGSGGNVVSMEHFYTGGEEAAEFEQYLKGLIKDFEEGELCTGDTCNHCIKRSVCQFQMPLIAKEKQISIKGPIAYSEEQKRIIDARDGKYCVVAAPGSGKTECICERVACMIKEGTDPDSILLITFTNAAAKEMKERVKRKCLEKGIILRSSIHAVTFHAFAQCILCDNYRILGYTREPEVIDTVTNLVIIKDILDENPRIMGLDYKNFTARGGSLMGALACAEKLFLSVKEEDIDPGDPDAVDVLRDSLSEEKILSFYGENSLAELLNLYDVYDKALKEKNKVVFADQERLMHKVLSMIPEYLENLGFRHIIMDEAQDSNDIQFATIDKLWNCSCAESLMIVGDDAQSIYGFRHTSPENFLRFSNEEGVKVLTLSANRRSTPKIIACSDQYMKRNVNRVEKSSVAVREDSYHENEEGKMVPDSPVIKGFYDKPDEMEFIVDETERLLKEGKRAEDIAIICMKKSNLIDFSAKLSERGIPWIMKNPMNLMENSRVCAALSLADAFVQPEADELYFNYLVARYEGKIFEERTIQEIREEISQLKKWFSSVMDDPDFEKQREIFHKLLMDLVPEKDEVYAYFLDLAFARESFIEELQYLHDFSVYGMGEAKRMEQNYEGVVLTTAHSAKGLEWDTVFLCLDGFDSESLHHPRYKYCLKDGEKIFYDERIEEKRRLIYVAMTRARDMLYITGKYIAFGSRKKEKDFVTGKTVEIDGRTPNQFLKELYEDAGMDFIPIDPMEETRKKEKQKLARSVRKQKSKQKEPVFYGKYSSVTKKGQEEIAKKAEKVKDFPVNVNGSRPMTDTEIRKYQDSIHNAFQMSLEMLCS
ncbi:MAG: ATP-dependent helicase [Eubacteriales bacterium]|nr:ATP-dependent helicase [Eubacteriales bacterium]